jgi:hypothetical protein
VAGHAVKSLFATRLLSRCKVFDDSYVDRYTKGPFFSVARITQVGDVVVNIEICNEEWLQSNASDKGFFYFVVSPDKEGGEAVAGLRYNPATEMFEQREVFPDDPDLLKQNQSRTAANKKEMK